MPGSFGVGGQRACGPGVYGRAFPPSPLPGRGSLSEISTTVWVSAFQPHPCSCVLSSPSPLIQQAPREDRPSVVRASCPPWRSREDDGGSGRDWGEMRVWGQGALSVLGALPVPLILCHLLTRSVCVFWCPVIFCDLGTRGCGAA